MNFNELSLAINRDLIGGSKGGKTPRKAVESPDTLKSIANARIIDAVSEGEIEGFAHGNDPAVFLQDVYFNETPVQNADGTRNFKNVQVDARLGTQDQPYIPGFPAVENEISIGVALTNVTPWTRSFTNLQLSAVNVRLAVSALSKTNNENGDITGTSVNYAIDLATDGGAFQTVMSSAFTGKTTGPYERTHRVNLPKAVASGWTVRVRRLTGDSSSSYIQDDTSVVSVTEIIDGKYRYPMTALVGTQIDASQFQSIPTRAFHLKGRRIKVPVNYNPELGTYDGIWNGTFKVAYSNNPAWVFYDLATNPRYGLGHLVQELEIDKYSLYAIGQYCDEIVPNGFGGTERRMTCNLYLQQAGDAFKVLGDLTSIFRGICYWTGGAIVPVADRPTSPVYTYTNANVLNGTFKYEGSDRRARHSAVIVSWNDMTDFGRLKNDYYDDDESLERYGFQLTTIVAMGCTSRGQAQRLAKWLLYSERLLTNSVSFSVGLDGTYAVPGQIVRIADKYRAGRRIGGRVTAATTTNIMLDRWSATPPAIGDSLTCIMPWGISQTRIISNVSPGMREVYVSVPFDAAPLAESVWAVDSNDLNTQLFRVLGVLENDDGTYGISALQHNPSLFDAVDLGEPIVVPDISAITSPIQQRPASVTITSTERAGQVVTSPLLTATWPAAARAQSYRVQWRKDAGEWSPVQEVAGLTADYQTPFPGTYECKVSAVNALGIVSIPQQSAEFYLADQSLKPGFVDELNADILEALNTAENALAIADGAVVSFWQPDPPVIGSGDNQAKVGDIWFDTNDGNRIYRVVGSVWVDAQDDQLAQALAAATVAQATADGKVKTFFQNTTPTATSIGDLWFNTTVGVKKLFRWNGTDWSSEIADVTLDQIGGSGVNLLPDQYSVLESTVVPLVTNSQQTATRGTTAIDLYAGIPGWAILRTGSGDPYTWLNSGGGNIPATPGKKYLVSGFVSHSVAGGQIRLLLGDDVMNSQGLYTCAAANTQYRFYFVADMTASTADRLKMGISNMGAVGTYARFNGLMVEELLGRRLVASSYSRGQAGSLAVGALQAAAAAQDTADGKIESFIQPSPPTIGTGAGQASLGDLWFDSDDGNKQYRCNGTAWVIAQDTAIGSAILAAAGAQATADGKVKTFYANANAAPTASGVGDLWYVIDQGQLLRWSGSAWQLAGDNSITTSGALLDNPNFEMGFTAWAQVDTGWYVEKSTNAAFQGLWGAVKQGGAGGYTNSRISNGRKFPVVPGEMYMLSSMVKFLGPASGNFNLGLIYLDSAGTYVGITDVATNAGELGINVWKRFQRPVVVPAGATQAYFTASMYGHSNSGSYTCVDQCSVVRLPSSSTELPLADAKNLIPNANLGGINGSIIPWAVGWNPGGQNIGARNKRMGIYAGSPYTIEGPLGEIALWENGVGSGSPAVCDFGLTDERSMAVTAGLRYQFHAKVQTHRCGMTLCIGWRDANGGTVGEVTSQTYPANATGDGKSEVYYPQMGFFAIAPAGAAYARVWFRKSNTNSGSDSYAFIIKPFFGLANVNQSEFSTWNEGPTASADEISAGTEFSVVNTYDTYQDGSWAAWSKRIGLRVSGSGQRLGSQRNVVRTQTSTYGAVRSTTALSATNAGAVSVNAHSVKYGSFSVSYNAVANAVTGLAQNTTYVIYCYDGDYSGGTKTYYAGTNPDAVMQLGDDVVVVGQILIPTSGSSSGGGGGSGSNPGDWCVDSMSYLMDGRFACEIDVGECLDCYDNDAENPGIRRLLVQNNATGLSECLRLVTESGAAIVASVTTPMTLRDGSCVLLPAMLGEQALVNRGGAFSWEAVVSLQPAGVRPVSKISVSDQCYFAGESMDAFIATHNITYAKP